MTDPPLQALPAQEVAEACARTLWGGDLASRVLGMVLEEIRPGYARLSMPVRADMVNGHRNCHGGLIFALADSTFAFACNSTNHVTVAAAASIDFLAPAKLGDVLIACGEAQSAVGRTGVYDIRVENQAGQLIALFRGRSHQLKEQLIPGLEVAR
ncbi:hydroxyphenylacetyl-CoA thioesterase PaaI [Nitrococcus mobilis]|uniref:Probable phenylacetic acid degradation protein n=1 Tax=Nitrococcus mobilis Nb-231 TaxID=314278 RepID=A4BNX3_9GAMM|nr:hydroxyphenylacetyl-CoA thioesterase PaaI [Nitrococcus mobilis]EAR22922.1 probable phenylacetic acid degradation protein [Nitrococcus mobilis Nb-231]